MGCLCRGLHLVFAFVLRNTYAWEDSKDEFCDTACLSPCSTNHTYMTLLPKHTIAFHIFINVFFPLSITFA